MGLAATNGSSSSLLDVIDRILDKVHRSGITSLTRYEKKILRQATEAEQRSRR